MDNVDKSIHSNTTRSIRSTKDKNEFHDIVLNGDQQQPPDYVELTMTGQNACYSGADGAVVINDSNEDHDGIVEYSSVTGGLDTTTSQYYDEDEEGDDNEEDAVDAIFIDDPDDMSHRSGCSTRSYRSTRSGRSSKSGRNGSKKKLTGSERDLTAF